MLTKSMRFLFTYLGITNSNLLQLLTNCILFFEIFALYLLNIDQIHLLENPRIVFLNEIFKGFLISYLFYIFVYLYPKYSEKEIIKDNLRRHIKSFKEGIIQDFLTILDYSEPSKLTSELTDIKKFRMYFSESYSETQTKWDKVLDELDLNPEYVKQITDQLQLLREELGIIIAKIQIEDQDLYELLKTFSRHIYHIRSRDQLDADALSRFFWPVFAGWDVLLGYQDEDLLETIIQKI